MKTKLRKLLDNQKIRMALVYIAEFTVVILLGLYAGLGTAFAVAILDGIIRRL